MSGIHRLLSLSTLTLSLGWATAAWAGDSPSVEDIKAAEADFNRGRESYKQGSYSEAAEHFESADGHAPNDRVLGLAIGAREKAGQLDRAATLAQLGMELYPDSDRIRKVAAPLVDKARADLLTIVVECTEACSVLDGPRLVHGLPAMRRTFFVTPGDHTVRAVWSDDRGDSKPATGKAGETASLAFTAPPIPVKAEAPVPVTGPVAPDAEPSQTEKPHGLPPLVFWIGAGTTAVLGGVTAWSGIDTVNNPGADAIKKDPACVDANCQLYKDGRSRQLRTNILIGATGVVGVATGIIGAFVTNWKGTPGKDAGAQAKLTVSPWMSIDGGPTVGAAGRF